MSHSHSDHNKALNEFKKTGCEIVSYENHPDSKKLHILKVDGGERLYDCVCGAPNAALGIKVAFVKAGGRVPGGEITKCKVAGYESEGMCCSEAELGISDENSGIMVLDQSLENGTDLKSVYDIDGDCIRNSIKSYRIIRYNLFKERTD